MPKREVLNYAQNYARKAEINTEWLKPWEVLRTGDVQQGLRLLGELSERNPGPPTLIGVGYLWTGKYEAAAELFRAAAHSKMTPSEDLFGFAGAAEWHLGNVPEAVKLWKEGMNAPYAAGGVCSRTKMLLLVSSILRPGSFSRREAEAELLEAVERIRLKWLAALGRFILGQIDEKSLEPLWLSEARYRPPRVLPQRKWLTEFYSAVLAVGRGGLNMDSFRRKMRPMVDAPIPEWQDTRAFTEILSNPEYFVARSEARLALADDFI